MLSRRTLTIPILLLLAALGASIAGLPGRLAAQAPADVEPSHLAPNAQFGMCFVSSAEDRAPQDRYTRAISAGASWNRYPFYWQNVERSAGVYDYAALDAVVSDDVANHVRTLAILMGTAGVHASGGVDGPGPQVQQKMLPAIRSGQVSTRDLSIASAASAPRDLNAPVFSDGTDWPAPGKTINPGNPWARYVYTTVMRYKPGGVLAGERGWPQGSGIRHWEIWNEPDWVFFWGGSVEQYYRLLQVAYVSAKFADPAATVMIGGLATYFNPQWFPALLDVMSADPDPAKRDANNQYHDAVAIHFYSRSRDAWDHMVRARYLLSARGLNKPLWVTESGVPVWNEYPGPTNDPKSPFRATTEEQAAYVVQAHAYALYAGAQVIFHFQLHDDCGNGPTAMDAYGLFRNPPGSACYPSDSAARTSLRAYQVAAGQMRGLTPLWRQTPNGDHEMLAFYRPGTGERVVVMWATDGHDVAARLTPTSGSAVLVDMYGNSRRVTPVDGHYDVLLPRATNQNLPESAEFMIGGAPYILVEQAVFSAPVELLLNGSFEAGLASWQTGGSTVPVIDANCRRGGKCVLLGKNMVPDPGLADNPLGGNSTVSQQVYVDPMVPSPYLRFWYRISNAETDVAKGWFEVLVIENPSSEAPVAKYLVAPRTWYQTTGWKEAGFDLSAWQGQTVRLVFNVYQSSKDEAPTLAWVDDVGIRDRDAYYTTIMPLVRVGTVQ